MLRRVSTYSSGVGLGEILKRGAPAFTESPTLKSTSETIPGMVDFTLVSLSGSMVPTARAFSWMSPRVTATSFGRLLFCAAGQEEIEEHQDEKSGDAAHNPLFHGSPLLIQSYRYRRIIGRKGLEIREKRKNR